MTDIFNILGLTADATSEELGARYDELKAKYKEDRFLEGDAGNEAARKLNELEEAFRMYNADIKRTEQEKQPPDYNTVEQLIKSGQLEDAQKMLDVITMRTAQWHYLQSIIYYKREWLTESRKQLVIAINLDPTNEAYTTALKNLDTVMGNPNVQQQNIGMQEQRAQNQANTLCRCCQAYICADCLCSLCGAGCCGG